ncbi:MAG: hypothetical protein QMC36_05860 [Patescibacteria group bacterium]
MAGNSQASNFKASELLDAVERLDSDKNGVTLEELRKTSRYYSEKLMDNLRSAAAELRTEKNPNPEKVATLRSSIERLAALNGLKASQEQEIKALYNGEMKDFYDLFAELKTRLDSLKAEVSAPKADKAAGAETVVVEPKTAKPSETVVVTGKETKSAPKAETKEVLTGFAAKREFLTADESLFQNAKGERTVGFGRPQLKKLLADPRIVGSETDFDRLVIRLAGAPINVKNEEESKKVRADFIENLSMRIVAISSLYERTVGEKLGDKASGGLLHILMGQEGELVKRMFDVSDALDKKGEGKGWNVTFQDIADTLKSIGLGAILGPVYLDWRTHKGIASEEIKTGGKTDKLGWATSDSKQNVELRVSPEFKLFGFALGVAVDVNANLNDREREIIGKVKETAKSYDSLIDPATGKMDETKVPKEFLEDAKDFNRAFESMRTGNPERDKAVSKAVRDAYLLELTDRLVRAEAGWELKGVGAGVALLFGILPLKAFVKVNGEKISASVTEGKVGTLSALDAVRLGKGTLDKYGIALKQTPEGYEYAIDPTKGYKIENRTDLKIENGVVKSKKPLYFKHLELVSDSMKEGEASVSTLVISDVPLDAAGLPASADAKKGAESIYVSASNDKLRNEVTSAMKGISSRNVRERLTGIPALQEAIAKAYASGNPEGAYKLLSHVKVEGKKPLAALAAAHAKDSAADKRELLNMVLQETAGDWRIRNFDAIKTDPKAFKDFVERTGYKGAQKSLKLADVDSAWNLGGTFDKNLLAKTGLGKEKDHKEALAALGKARAEYSKELGKLDSINNNTREIKNAIGFVNFHQVAIGADGKSYKRFQEVVPVAGTVKAVNVEPTKFESAAMRRQLVAEIPSFVLESLRATINEQAKKVGAAEIGSIEDVRKLLVNNGSKAEGAFRPDIQLTNELAYTRFAKCLNDTYLIQNINLCVTGPNGQTTCAPTIPEVTSDLLATVGTKETNATNVAAGVAFNTGIGGGGKGNDNPNNPNNNTTTPGVTPGGVPGGGSVPATPGAAGF